MERDPEDAPLAPQHRTGSEQELIQPPAAPGGSNSRALKIAGITALVCLLLSAQAFTSYLVFDQRQQIQGLQMSSQKMEQQMGQGSRGGAQKIVMPISSVPLLDIFDDEISPASPTVQMNKALVEDQLQEFMKDFELPHFNKSFLANLQALKLQVNDTSWKSFESWLRCWLFFQMAQKPPTPPPASVARTKCQTEAAAGLSGTMAAFRPQCDEQGNYRSVQCWHSARLCWCVDQSGTPIEGSNTLGRPNCDSPIAPKVMV